MLDGYLQGTIPAESWHRLAAWCAELITHRERERRHAPGGVRLPDVPAELRWWAWFADDAARKFVDRQQAGKRAAEFAAREIVAELSSEIAELREQLSAACATPNPAGGAVVALPQNSPSSEEQWVGTEEAKRITGLSQECMRLYAASGRVRARKRLGRWEIHTGSLRERNEQRRGVHGTHGGEDDGQSPGNEPGRADSGSGEGRSQAA